jgi:ketosteroid isomerase-like protein
MNPIFVIFSVFLVFSSCQNNSENKTVAANQTIVKNYFDTFNRHDWAKMADFYTETADFKDPSLGKGIMPQTRAQTIKKYAELNQIFPDLHDEIMQIYPSGEKNVIVEFISSGTSPDGTKFELPICTILTLENGKITKDFTYFDNFEEGK